MNKYVYHELKNEGWNTRWYPQYRGMGMRLCTVSKFGNRTRTRGTRFRNTAGFPVPVPIPTLL
jgi:hypothetical protein